jgi:hypothetical protein
LNIRDLVIFILISVSTLLSSNGVLAASMMIDVSVNKQDLAPYVSYYMDISKQLEIADIKKPNALVWSPPKDKRLNFGFSNAAIWLTTTLSNPSSISIDRVIELPYSLIDNVEFYHVNQQGRLLSNYIMGSELHFSSRPIAHHNFIIPISIAPNSSSQLFFRLTGSHSLQAPLTMWSNNAFWQISQFENRFNFAYFTLLFGLMAYALYRLSPQPRIRRFIFPGMIITPLLALVTIEGYAFQYVWPEHPFWNRMGLATLIPGSLTFLSLYLYIIFSKMALGNRWHHLLLSLGAANILLLIAPIAISYTTALILDLIAATIFFFLLSYLSIRHWQRLSRPNKVTLLGFFWLSFGSFIFVLEITNIIPSFPLIEAPLQVGFFLYVFSLFWAQLNIYARAVSIFKKKSTLVGKKKHNTSSLSPPTCNDSASEVSPLR